jgi:biotin transport system substrate-specific component
MSTIAVELAPRARVGARVVFAVGCAVVGSLLVAGLAQISFTLPFTPVPVTGQTLGVLLVGAAYGPGLGAATLALYLLWAVIGLPVLAPDADGSHRTGIEVLALAAATGGYLWGFVVAAGLTGWLATLGWDRTLRSSISAMLLGSVAIYAIGIPWLAASAGVSIGEALELGLYPFVVGDLLKLLAAAGLLPIAWGLVHRLRPGGEG